MRETRHLWVGNLPENINEDRIKEHFKRYVRAKVKVAPGGPGLVGCVLVGGGFCWHGGVTPARPLPLCCGACVCGCWCCGRSVKVAVARLWRRPL